MGSWRSGGGGAGRTGKSGSGGMDAAVAAAAAAAHPRSPAAQQVSLVGEPAVQLACKTLRVLLCHKNCPSQHPGGIGLARQWASQLACTWLSTCST